MQDYPRKALMITWLTYFAFGFYQLFSNDALVFPSPMNAVVVLGISVYSLVAEFKNALKSERIGLILFLFSAITMFLSDSFMMSIFLEHEIVSDWFTSPYLLVAQNIALLTLLGSLLVISVNLAKINKLYVWSYSIFFLTLIILGFVDVRIEALVVLVLVGILSLIIAIRHHQQIPSATYSLLYLWVIHVSIACFEYWNLNL